MSDEHPLRGVITCPTCERKFTSRNTSKMIGKGPHKKKKLYPYYGCNNRKCPQKVNAKKQELEKTFESLLNRLRLPKRLLLIVDKEFTQTRNQYTASKEKRITRKKKEIQTLKNQQKTVEHSLIKTSNPKLYQSLEEQWATLDHEINEIEDALKNVSASENRKKSLLLKSRLIFEDPLAMRSLGNQDMRRLLITVRFGDQLYYSNSHGLQTAENGCLYSLMI